MKHSTSSLRGMTLFTAGAILCLGANVAQCQRAGRAVSRAAFGRAATSQGSASQATAGQGSGSSGTTCPNGGSSQTGSSTTTQSSTGSINTTSNQAATGLSASRLASNQLLVQWTGNTSNVKTVYLGVLDANGRVLAQRAVTQLPVQANLTLTASARYYGVQVVYSDGTTNTRYAPIR
jgi:hypothetical protein